MRRRRAELRDARLDEDGADQVRTSAEQSKQAKIRKRWSWTATTWSVYIAVSLLSVLGFFFCTQSLVKAHANRELEVLEDVVQVYRSSNLVFWVMGDCISHGRVDSGVCCTISIGVIAHDKLSISQASGVLLRMQWNVVDSNSGLFVCKPELNAPDRCSEDGLNLRRVEVRFFYEEEGKLSCPCCECVKGKDLGACAKRTCNCVVLTAATSDVLPTWNLHLPGTTFGAIPIQRNVSISRLHPLLRG
ncbi:hypothetical protein NDN08_006062 [Rhodosorus marinus]|uniref:Transmembrane protein n=1 Tax=Rhodosorus marinus TaxID=101924 RepID=A0AAV8UNG8_9RHOD|nr:hypothetical protein NDN08_006062 [Rhodosorus marinus]